MNCFREQLTDASGITSVQLKGLARPAGVETPDVHFIILADKSGSMTSERRLENLKLSLDHLLDFMRERDLLTVLPFDHRVSLPPLIAGETCTAVNKSNLRERLATLASGGSTNIGLAISSVRAIMASPIRPGPIKTGVILLTDGEATDGHTHVDDLLALQQGIQGDFPDITLSTVGYGDGHNAGLLSSLAISGSYNIVRNLNDVAAVFGNILGGLRTVVGQSCRLLVPSHVRQRTTFKTSVRPDGLQEILVGDIIENGEQTIILDGLIESDRLRIEYHAIGGAAVAVDDVICSTSDEGQATGLVAYLRCQTVEVLARANTHLMRGEGPNDALLAEIAALQEKLRAIPPSPVITTLLSELDRARRYVTMPPGPPALMRTASNALSQHTAYLGTARGIMSSGGADDEDVHDPSIFATVAQRTISIGLTESVTRSPASQTVAAANPHSLYLSPATSLDTSNSSSSSSFPLPPNNPTLHRS